MVGGDLDAWQGKQINYTEGIIPAYQSTESRRPFNFPWGLRGLDFEGVTLDKGLSLCLNQRRQFTNGASLRALG